MITVLADDIVTALAVVIVAIALGMFVLVIARVRRELTGRRPSAIAPVRVRAEIIRRRRDISVTSVLLALPPVLARPDGCTDPRD